MCNDPKYIKFCTCEIDPTQEPDWILQRRDTTLPQRHVVGKVARPQRNIEKERWQEAMLEALNSSACFDFPYEPQENDILQVRHPIEQEIHAFRFLFSQKKWTHDTSTRLAPWRVQMVEVAQGPSKISLDLPTLRTCLAKGEFLLVWQAIPWLPEEMQSYARSHIPEDLQKVYAKTMPNPKPVKPNTNRESS
ncbi:MAG: hypothetical protein H6727_06310 [Myxococcales bacterium]|nr:hypothetical protein [Myxococcales bacterium]